MNTYLKLLLDEPLEVTTKGVGAFPGGMTLGEISSMRWNVLAEDLPFPVAILKQSAVGSNLFAMRDYVSENGILLCPHGKTTMAPQLFLKQLEMGAWGITVATTSQLAVCLKFGVNRILLANQLVGSQNIRIVADAVNANEDLELYCLVDSVQQVNQLRVKLTEYGLERPLNILIEVGLSGGRCGVRRIEDGLNVARQLAKHPESYSLVGIEAFEGAVIAHTENALRSSVEQLLTTVKQLAGRCDTEGLFSADEVIVTAGGSLHFHLVEKGLRDFEIRRKHKTILRSGCYLTHDHGMYKANADEISRKVENYPSLVPALEVWACVQSVPEKGRLIVALGKRDISFDISLPTLLHYFDGEQLHHIDASAYCVDALYDHHAVLSCEPGTELQVGGLCGFGVSHPCTTFDKWPLIYLVDDDYTVVEGIKTFF
jgi:D-serine dehydratase